LTKSSKGAIAINTTVEKHRLWMRVSIRKLINWFKEKVKKLMLSPSVIDTPATKSEIK